MFQQYLQKPNANFAAPCRSHMSFRRGRYTSESTDGAKDIDHAELLKLAQQKQLQIDEMGMEEESFIKRRPEPTDPSKVKDLHENFRSTRPDSVPATRANVQALLSVQKQQQVTFREATANQASLLLEGRLQTPWEDVPANHKSSYRSRRLSGGLEVLESMASFTNIWAQWGTQDDKFRPENNAAGFVIPTAHELVNDVLVKAEKERVEELLRKINAAQRRYSPTHPITPRLGPRLPEALSSTPEPAEPDKIKHVLRNSPRNSPRLGGLGNSEVSDRPLCYTRPLHATTRPGDKSFLLKSRKLWKAQTDETLKALKLKASSAAVRQSPTRKGVAHVFGTESAAFRRAQTELFFGKLWKRAELWNRSSSPSRRDSRRGVLTV